MSVIASQKCAIVISTTVEMKRRVEAVLKERSMTLEQYLQDCLRRVDNGYDYIVGGKISRERYSPPRPQTLLFEEKSV